MLASLANRLRLLASEEAGIALPVAMFAMVASVALAGAAVVSTVDVQQGSHRDSSAKRAIAAADAGANLARMRQTRFGYQLNSNNPCLVMGAGEELSRGPAVDEGGQQRWCPPVQGTVGGAAYEYQVSAVGLDCGEFELCVVSTGTADTVSRRIEVTYNRSGTSTNETESEFFETTKTNLETKIETLENLINGEPADPEDPPSEDPGEDPSHVGGVEGLIGRDNITLSGNADIRVGVGTNGNLVTSGNTSICGSVRYGIGKEWSKTGNVSQCQGYGTSEGNVDLPPVSSFMPANIATDNSNARLVTCKRTSPVREPPGCQSDTLSGTKWGSTYPFDPGSRTLSLSGNSTLTVGGGDYWLCGISFSGNSQLIMADGARVRFFFDTPEHCGYNGNPINMSGNNRIAATGYQPGDQQWEMPGFYFLGSPTIVTQVNLSGNTSTVNEMVVYGPDTYVNISGNATFKGVIAGRQVAMSGNGRIEQDSGFELLPELNPWIPAEEDDGDDGDDGGPQVETLQEELDEAREELDELINSQTTRTNAIALAFTPQAYFECTGVAPAAGAPNASC